jgi:protein ImuB
MFACIYCKSVSDSASLVDFAYGFSPLVEASDANTVVIDAGGCEALFGSVYELANEMSRRALTVKAAGGLGRRVNVAVAANPDTAILAAHFFAGLTFISPGEESVGLGELPIEKLKDIWSALAECSGDGALDDFATRRVCVKSDLTQRRKGAKTQTSEELRANPKRCRATLATALQKIDEILETLRLWGIRTFGDFARLPPAGVAQRLGQEGARLQRLAQGKSDRQLILVQPPLGFAQSIELDYPLKELEPLSFILGRLLNQLCANLSAHALATNELSLRLQLEDGTKHERTITLPVPMRDGRVFLRLLLLDAEMHPPQSAVIAVTIAAEPAQPRALQNGLFIPLAPEPEKLEVTLARLRKLLGAENVGSPELLDTHRPDGFQMRWFSLKFHHSGHRGKNSKFEIRNPKCLLGLRVFRPPRPAEVETDNGQPTRIKGRDKRSLQGKVLHASGPWRASGDWWRPDAWGRDEWDVAVEGGLCRIYRDLRDDAWFVEGVYD